MRKYSVLLILSLVTFTVDAQRWKLKRYEGMAGIGTTYILGDVGGNMKETLGGITDFDFSSTRPSIYLGARYKLREEMSARFNVFYGFAKSDDKNSRNEPRGTVSTTHLFEVSTQFEYYFLREDRRLKSAAVFNRRGMVNNYARTAYYAFVGAGALFYNPTTNGQNDQYHMVKQGMMVTPSVPIGLGLKYSYNSKLSIGFEIGGRLTFSDYLEGYSSFYYGEHDDFLYFTSLSLIYKVRTDRRNRPVLFRR